MSDNISICVNATDKFVQFDELLGVYLATIESCKPVLHADVVQRARGKACLGIAAPIVIAYNLSVDRRFQETNQLRLRFIKTDLDVCLTFAAVAETAYSIGHREHAERTIASAEKGYDDMLRFYFQATEMTAEAEMELWSIFRQVRERLDRLKRRVERGVQIY